MIRKTIIMEDRLKSDIERFARMEDRDFSGAMRYAARIGLIALENPELTVQEIKDILEAKIDLETGRTTEIKAQSL
jgi:hypothetical protein